MILKIKVSYNQQLLFRVTETCQKVIRKVNAKYNVIIWGVREVIVN